MPHQGLTHRDKKWNSLILACLCLLVHCVSAQYSSSTKVPVICAKSFNPLLHASSTLSDQHYLSVPKACHVGFQAYIASRLFFQTKKLNLLCANAFSSICLESYILALPCSTYRARRLEGFSTISIMKPSFLGLSYKELAFCYMFLLLN